MLGKQSSAASHSWRSGQAIAIDLTIGGFNVFAGLLLFSAAASNFIVYDISMRIVTLMAFFVIVGVALISLELFPLAAFVEQYIPHLNTFFGRGLTYLLFACLVCDSRMVHVAHSGYYLWLWANSIALGSLTIAFTALSVLSYCIDLPKPKSMDAKRAAGYDSRLASAGDMEHGVHGHHEGVYTVGLGREQPSHLVDSMATIDGLSIASIAQFKGASFGGHGSQDRYTAAPSTRRSSHAHNNKWRSGAPPNHTSTWSDEKVHTGHVGELSGSSDTLTEGTRRQSAVLSQDGSYSEAPSHSRQSFKNRRLSFGSSSDQAKPMPRYATTTERMADKSPSPERSPPAQWCESMHEGVRRNSMYHHELSYAASVDADAVKATRSGSRNSHSNLPKLHTGPFQQRPNVRRLVYVPSISAAIELSSGESSSEDEDGNEDDDDDDERSVYSLPSGISPEEVQKKISPSQDEPVNRDQLQSLGRRLTRKETRSVRKKLERGIQRDASLKKATVV